MIAANDLKTQGVGAIDKALADQLEVPISVRGKVKYVVMKADQYHHLRECELEAALAETRADLAAGDFVRQSPAEHVRRMMEQIARG